MPYRRLTGTEYATPQAGASRSSGTLAMQRHPDGHAASPTPPYLRREQNWSVQERYHQDAAGRRLEDDVVIGRTRTGRPRFARVQASIAERPSEWAWQYSREIAGPSAQRGRVAPRPADAGMSTRALWLGGGALILLASGVIAAIAMVQSSRPVPFETWAQRDLMHDPGAVPDLASSAASISDAADRQRGAADAGLAPETGVSSPEVEIAALGPILASATAAEEVTARLPLPAAAPAAVAAEASDPRPLRAPPRPVFKPPLMTSDHQEVDAPSIEPVAAANAGGGRGPLRLVPAFATR
jgi:hypothetical protein